MFLKRIIFTDLQTSSLLMLVWLDAWRSAEDDKFKTDAVRTLLVLISLTPVSSDPTDPRIKYIGKFVPEGKLIKWMSTSLVAGREDGKVLPIISCPGQFSVGYSNNLSWTFQFSGWADSNNFNPVWALWLVWCQVTDGSVYHLITPPPPSLSSHYPLTEQPSVCNIPADLG